MCFFLFIIFIKIGTTNIQ
uniref:Uncharacterized protein n=1 Tax=Arundo donax TaxID=35708 RepID=A0A0A8YYT3_ARUDO